jgi:2-dehydro-3-deoxygalactonokinase
MPDPIRIIGLDWGSSNLRAFAFGHDGAIVERRVSTRGAMKLASEGAFERTLDDIVGDWIDTNPTAELIASGMVGARGGWVEAGYAAVNSDAAELRARASTISLRCGRVLRVVPGVKSDEPDVMRGEETQIVGAGVEEGLIVLPGTHSKWVRVKAGRIAAFKSCFTGEMNALVREQSTIGKALSSPPSVAHEAAIERGVKRALETSDWLHQLFLFRARVVSGANDEAEVSSEFSAWLIASEFQQMRSGGFQDSRLTLIATEALAGWYGHVARVIGVECLLKSGDECAAKGLWRVAMAP